ncbi:MAG: hypothetical protein ACHQ4H_09465 [Ktedonobacterales bacterium]
MQRIAPRRLALVALVARWRAGGTGSLAIMSRSTPTTGASPLTAAPSQLALACSGKSTSVTLALHWSGAASATWTVTPPAGLSLSLTHGTLKPRGAASLTVKVTKHKAAHGTLGFVAAGKTLAVPYTVTCS